MLTIDNIAKLSNISKELTVVVADREHIWDESYAENGMIGVITSFILDETTAQNVNVYKMTIDWERFSDNNTPLEANDYFLKNSAEQGTMKQAGCYPLDGIEELYVQSDCDSGFKLFDESVPKFTLFNAWQKNGANLSYIEYLENLAIKSINK